MAKRRQGTHCMLRIREASGVRIEDLVRDLYRVGRGDASGEVHVDFALTEDVHVSRLHFELRRDGSDFLLENKSPNGTFVNGVEAKGSRRLAHGDRIAVGSATTLEFLVLDDAQRARELASAAGAPVVAGAAAAGADRQKRLLERPVVWMVLAFYLVVILVVVGMSSEDAPASLYPGPGPYLGALLSAPIETVTPSEDARALAEAAWRRARETHEGQIDVGAHAYYLVQAARQLMRVRGHPTLGAAVAAGDSDARFAKEVLDRLEARLAGLMREAVQYLRGGHATKAHAIFEEILAANPDRGSALRRYAHHRIARMQPGTP